MLLVIWSLTVLYKQEKKGVAILVVVIFSIIMRSGCC